MADSLLTGEKLVSKDAISRIEQIDEGLIKVIKTYDELISKAQLFNTPKQGNNVINERNKLDGKFVSLQKEKIAILKRIEKQEARNTLISTDASKQLAAQRFETQKLNKENKQNAILTSRYADAYDKLAVRLAIAKRNLKNLTIEEGRFSNATVRARQEVDKLNVKMAQADNVAGDFQRKVGQYPTTFTPAIGAIRQLVGAFGLVEGLRIGFDFTKESLDLAREAKGVEFAFARLGEEGQEAFEKVRESTRGLLSDLDIRRSLVEFDNFNISLAETDTLFEFLSVRAAQTGQSVDKLKDSLVEGLSKESKLRIDNLGISASELNDELSKTPDFVQAVANIAKREVAEAGDILDSAANSQEQFNAALENAKIAFGELVAGDGFNFFSLLTDQISKITQGIKLFQIAIDSAKTGIENFTRPIVSLIQRIPLLNRLFSFLSENTSNFIDALFVPGITSFSFALIELSARLSGLGASFSAGKDAAFDFIRTLASFGDIEFSLDPLENFKNIKDFFNKSKDSFIAGGKSVSEAFTEAYNDALNFEKSNKKATDEVKKIQEIAGNAESSTIQGTIKFFEELIKKTEEQRDSTAKTAEEYEAFEKIIDRIRDKIKDIRINGVEQKVALEDNSFFATDLINPTALSVDDINSGAQTTLEIDQFRDKEERKTAIQEENERKRRAFLTETIEAAQDLYGVDLSNFVSIINDKEFKELSSIEKTVEYAAAAQQTLLSFSDAILSGTLNRLEEEENANRAKLQTVLDDESATESEKQDAQKRYDAENLKIRQKQFKAEQDSAIANAIINGAVAVLQAYAQLGPVGGTIAAALIAGLTAFQITNIKKQKPPQFFKGKKATDNFEGVGSVNEKPGQREVGIDEHGNVELFPAGMHYRDIKKKDIIIPSISQYDREMKDPTSDTFKRVNQKLISDTNFRTNMVVVHNNNDFGNLEERIEGAIQKGFKRANIVINQKPEKTRRTRFAI